MKDKEALLNIASNQGIYYVVYQSTIYLAKINKIDLSERYVIFRIDKLNDIKINFCDLENYVYDNDNDALFYLNNREIGDLKQKMLIISNEYNDLKHREKAIVQRFTELGYSNYDQIF